MQQKDLELHVIAYSAAISAGEKAKWSEKAFELLEIMQQKCLQSHTITYIAVHVRRPSSQTSV